MPRVNERQKQYMRERGFLVMSEAADLAFVSPSTIYKMVSAGKVEHIKQSGIVYVKCASLAEQYPEPIRARILDGAGCVD